jgi:hypothetical protein
MTDTLSDKIVEAGARAMWGEGYDNNPHFHDAIHSDMRAALSAALAVAEAEGVVLCRVPSGADPACRAATLAGKVTL